MRLPLPLCHALYFKMSQKQTLLKSRKRALEFLDEVTKLAIGTCKRENGTTEDPEEYSKLP